MANGVLHETTDRRAFLKSAAAFGVAGAAFRSWCAAHGADFDFKGAAESCGWHETDKDAFYFLHATDLHMTENPDIERGAMMMKDKFMGRCFIDEVNAMNALKARPETLLLTGDLTSNVSMNPSCWAFAERKWRHFRKYVTDRLQVPCRQIIGNNDCARVPYEKAFPDFPVNWSFEKGGVLFVALHGYNCWKPENTNHAGILYDAEQLAGLDARVRNSSARTLVLVTHEPLSDKDSHAACSQLAPIVARFPGEEIWNIAGHGHCNVVASYVLGGRVVRYVQTFTPVGSGFTVGDGGFRVFFCSDGLIRGSAIRWLTSAGEPIGYQPVGVRDGRRIDLLGDWSPKGALAVHLVGRDPYDIAGSVRIENRLADYYICRRNKTGVCGNLVWRVPRLVNKRQVVRVLINCGRIAGRTGISPDGSSWTFSNVNWTGDKAVREITVPASYAGDSIWLSLSNESRCECKFFGCALMPS